MESGYRITKGTRISEKIYCRAANLFYEEVEEGEQSWYERPDGKEFVKSLGILIRNYLKILILIMQHFINCSRILLLKKMVLF